MHFQRRELLIGTACCAACSALSTPLAAREVQEKVASLKQIKGCFIDSNNSSLMLGANFVSGRAAEMPPEVETMLRSTGNSGLDRAFDRALQRLAETFDVWPKVGFYDDAEAPNAMAMRYLVGANVEYAVVFGRTYFKKLLSYDPSGITVLQTAAHEFAHVWVYRDRMFDNIRGGDSTVKRVELHADFLSGYYLGLRKRDNPDAKFRSAGVRRWQSGDTQFLNIHHHGTPEQRLAAAEEGFKLGFLKGVPAALAFAAATDWVATQ